MHEATASMATRLQALEGKILECGFFRLDYAALISELATLNSNVKALTEAMLLNLKHCQESTKQKLKLNGDKATVPNTNSGKTLQPPPPSPLATPEGAERTRYYTRVHSGSRSKEVGSILCQK